MNPPPFRTRLLGHAIVFLPMSAVTLGTVWTVVLNHDAWPMLIVVAWLMNISLKANQQVAAYKAWKRAWDSMAPDAPPRQRRSQRGLAIALIGLLTAYLALTQDQPGHGLALGWMAAVAIVAVIVMTARVLFRRIRRAAPRKAATVRICVTKPLLPVPSLRDAYVALPPYCQQLLGNQL